MKYGIVVFLFELMQNKISYKNPYKKHIDASVKERPQTLLVPSEEIYVQ